MTLDIYRHQIGGEPGHVAHPSSLSDLHQRLLTGSGVGGDHVGPPPGADPSRPELGQFSRQLLTNPSETMHPFGNAGVLAGGSEDVALLPYLAGGSENIASLSYLVGGSENVALLPYLVGGSENIASPSYPAGGFEHVASPSYPPPEDFQGIQPLDLSLSLLSLIGDHTHFELHALASQTPPAFSGQTFAGTYGELPDSSDGTSLLSPTSTFAYSFETLTVSGDPASSYGTPTVSSDPASPSRPPEGFPGPYASPFAENQLDYLANLPPAYSIGTRQAVSGERVLPSRPPEGFSGQPPSTNAPGNDTGHPRRVRDQRDYHRGRREKIGKTQGGRTFLKNNNLRGDTLRRYRYQYVEENYQDKAKSIRTRVKVGDLLSIINKERAKKNEGPWTLQDLNRAAEEHALRKEQEKETGDSKG